MKRVLLILTAFTICNITAQTTAGGGDLTASGIAQQMIGQAGGYNGFVIKNNNRRAVDGTYYLFDEWENNAIIYTSDSQRFLLKNINLNLQRNAFESQISKDSTFTFNFNNIDRFVIKNKVYKNYYWDDDNRVYQVIFENKDFQILKGFKVVFVEGSANPMLNRSRDKYFRKEKYLVRIDGEIKPFKLKKNKIIKLIKGDDVKTKKIVDYANQNDLSFSNEMDVRKILDFSDNN